MTLNVVPYGPELRDAWNARVASSKNGTFLFDRGYMDYHAARFADASLVVYDDAAPVALFPASRAGDVVSSHGGLTYGGFVTGDDMTAEQMLGVFDVAAAHFAKEEIGRASCRERV